MDIINPLMQFLLRRPYGVHSPFLYAFARACLYRSQQNDESDCIRRLASLTHQRKRHCRLYYRMAAYLQPATILDLGTSPGMTAACFAKGYPKAMVLSINGCGEASSHVPTVLQEAGLNNVSCITGAFHEVLPVVLEDKAPIDMACIRGDLPVQGVIDIFYLLSKHMSPEGVIILEDIRRSGHMWTTWKQIFASQHISLSVDLGTLGIMFFSHKLSKQNVFLGF